MPSGQQRKGALQDAGRAGHPYERVGPGQWRIEKHWVDLHNNEQRCDCAWWEWKGLNCRHIKVALKLEYGR